jgi:hypothetical protein
VSANSTAAKKDVLRTQEDALRAEGCAARIAPESPSSSVIGELLEFGPLPKKDAHSREEDALRAEGAARAAANPMRKQPWTQSVRRQKNPKHKQPRQQSEMDGKSSKAISVDGYAHATQKGWTQWVKGHGIKRRRKQKLRAGKRQRIK